MADWLDDAALSAWLSAAALGYTAMMDGAGDVMQFERAAMMALEDRLARYRQMYPGDESQIAASLLLEALGVLTAVAAYGAHSARLPFEEYTSRVLADLQGA